MKTKSLAALALVAASTMAADRCFAQTYPQPTKAHEQLAREAGVWDAEMTMWMAPGAEPMTQSVTETNKMFGGFWLLSEFKCEGSVFPFEGRMNLGYDTTEQKYVGTWIDTMSPYPSRMSGTYDVKTHKLTMVSKARDFQTSEWKTSTMITHFIDDDTKTFTMYAGEPGDDGKMADDAWKMMEIKYKRRK